MYRLRLRGYSKNPQENKMDRLPVSINPCPIAEAIFEVRFETTYPGDAIFGIIYNPFKDEFPKPIWPKKSCFSV